MVVGWVIFLNFLKDEGCLLFYVNKLSLLSVVVKVLVLVYENLGIFKIFVQYKIFMILYIYVGLFYVYYNFIMI